ncbi:Single-stranded DNA-binding protein [subsurface metagenome]
MSWDINHVILVGRLTRDPELTYIQSGAAICKFSIAVNRSSGSGGD